MIGLLFKVEGGCISINSAFDCVTFSIMSLLLWIFGKTYRWLVFQSKLVIKSCSLSVRQSSCFFFFFFFFFFFLYSIKNLQDELPITIPTNYSTKHYKDDNTTGSSRL